ncbi:uncharacterized protein EI90DRAFT_3047893 [Cantharellus anzutake]|uniref:uncharacterized protein n=1 Tax=Cantharellus anzutake TaxID=1750568 RepID=UPI0019067F52|nr:uncharacterized protein EI90DRAFT_3047893 [Cantharellus anzutake]KAF8335317.1 hypothetical protein EI90DRAFT_3047893 [Cantharellus anzutake]
MFRRAVLFLLLLFIASVFAVRGQELRRVAPRLRDPVHGDTNAKRLARGLPLLPPARRKNIEASRTEAARRAQASDTNVWMGKLQVADSNGTTLGYLALADYGNRYTVREESDAATFTASLNPQSGMTFRNNNPQTPYPYLAGLIEPDVILRWMKTTSAILGGSASKSSPNNKPQLAMSEPQVVSIDGMQFETAIWSCNSTGGLTPDGWTDRDGGQPELFIVWDGMSQTIYLTADRDGVVANNPDPHVVTLSLSSN